MRREQTPVEALHERIRVTEAGCWDWLLYRTQHGYGRWVFRGVNGYAHRMAYEFLVGPIPDGTEIDHLCRNRACVNPAHLEPVTHTVNVRRGESQPPKNRLKTHCIRGHEFTPENTAIDAKGWRSCLTCHRESSAAWRAENRERAREVQREATRRHREKYAEERREAARIAKEQRMLSCRNGHPRTPENTYVYPGGMAVCLPCRQARGLLLTVG